LLLSGIFSVGRRRNARQECRAYWRRYQPFALILTFSRKEKGPEGAVRRCERAARTFFTGGFLLFAFKMGIKVGS
jgi:hypothetical protein